MDLGADVAARYGNLTDTVICNIECCRAIKAEWLLCHDHSDTSVEKIAQGTSIMVESRGEPFPNFPLQKVEPYGSTSW